MHTLTESNSEYRTVQKVLHWLMALLIILDLVAGQGFNGVLEDSERFEARINHATVGTITAVLLIMRIFFRVKYGAPALPNSMSPLQKTFAKWVHVTFYVLIACMILTGIATGLNTVNPIEFYNTFELSTGNNSEETFQFIRSFHEGAANTLIVLIAIHILAGLYHQFILKDGIMGRMLKSRRLD